MYWTCELAIHILVEEDTIYILQELLACPNVRPGKVLQILSLVI